MVALACLVVTAGAQAQDSIRLVAIDADVTGNEPASIGSVDSCISVDVGASLNIDVVVDEIPPEASDGFQFGLLFDPSIVHVTGYDIEQLLASGGATQPVDFSADPNVDGKETGDEDTVPEGSDGSFTVALADFGPNSESGKGVLARITLSSVGQGIVTLSLSNLLINNAPGSDPGNSTSAELPVQFIQDAQVAVGQPCSGPALTPRPAPTAAPREDETPDPDGETAGATPGPNDTPAASSTPDGSTAGASTSPGTGGGDSQGNGDGDGGGNGWVVVVMVVGVLAAIGAAAAAYWLRRQRGQNAP
jgi:hypothetical protein